MIFSQKNILKDNISSITEKDDNYPRNYGTFSDRKIKDDKKVYFYKKSCSDSLYDYTDLYRSFQILLSNETKNKKLNL